MKSIYHRFGINVRFFETMHTVSRILDFGCGQGEISRYLIRNGHLVIAADIDPASEKKLRCDLSVEENNRLSFIMVQREEPFVIDEIGKFDYVICREVLEHVDDPNGVIGLFSRVLKDKGLLVLSVPTSWSENFFKFWDPNWLNKSEHLRIFKNKDIHRLLSENLMIVDQEEGQSFRWTLFWLFLAPLRIKHKMGNPEIQSWLVKIAFNFSNGLCSLFTVERIGNRILPKSNFYYAIKRKPRVLVVYDYHDWILGKWAKNIHRIYSTEYDIATISMFHARMDVKYTTGLVNNVDIVHLLLPHPFEFFKQLANDRAIITTIHHWIPGGDDYESAIFGSDRLLTGAKFWMDRLIERGVPFDKITVVHSGVENRFFQQEHALLNISSKQTLGFFAKMDSNESDRKGIRHLLKLAVEMAELGVTDRFRLVISGPGWENHISCFQEVGLETIYYPFVEEENMPALYRSLDVYLMLSDVEGGPVMLAEAMASGCLVFTTRVGIAQEIINDKHTGLLIDNSQPNLIIEKLLYYANNPDKRLTICDNARKFANEYMHFDQTMRPLYTLYSEVLGLGKTKGKGKWEVDKVNQINDLMANRVKS